VLSIKNELSSSGLIAGVILAKNISIHDSPDALKAELLSLIEERKTQDFPPPELKEAVRALLRRGGFKPTGRNKPASEYLAQAARESRFPFINNLVDINNLLSLKSGFPISLLDADICGTEITLRTGREGEKYVFNQSGQEIDLCGLICACGAGPAPGEPLGNAVKDSMKAKIKPATVSVLGFIYAPAGAIDKPGMTELLARFAELLTTYAAAGEIVMRVE
jgi:DNA/RNA-binding domain of Phe-tRNA-synthetase-like protein